MDTESLTRKYYGYLKTLPNIKTFSIISSIESALIFLRSFQLTFDYLYSFIVYASLVFVIFKGKIKLSLFIVDLSGASYLILSVISIPTVFAFGFFMPLMAYILLGSYRELSSIFLSFMVSLSPILFYLRYVTIYTLYIFIIALIFHIYIYTVNRKGVKILGFKSVQVAIPFITAVTEKNKTPLENFLNFISTKTNLNILIYKLDEYLFTIPQIHFGIFDSVGSSRFVYEMENRIGKNIIVFHGPGSHELDLASSIEVNKVLNEIIKELPQNDWNKAKFYSITSEKIGNFEITSLEFDKFKISFLERPEFGIDDLPSSLWKYMLISNNYVIDCHNSFMVKEYTREEIESLKAFIMEQHGIKEEKRLFLGYSEGKLEGKCEGLCDNRIRVVTFSDGSRKISIIYLYANNSTAELNAALKNALKNVVDKVILVTPDDHSCTGISLGLTYSPAKLCDEIINKAVELVKASMSNMKEVKEIKYKLIKVKGVKIIGKMISIMLKALEDVGSYTSKTFWIPLISPYLLLIIILLLQNLVKL